MNDEDINIKESKILMINNDVILRKEKFGGLVILKRNSNIFIFNKFGFEILNSCKTGIRINFIIKEFSKKYKIAEEIIRKDVLEFIKNTTIKNITTIF
jgi:hypothetical protein